MVKVRMYATVRECAGVPEIVVHADELGSLLRELGRRFGTQFSMLTSGPEGVVVLVNGRTVAQGARMEVRLEDDDEVSIFPPISGG